MTEFSLKQILQLLPHRYPFLMIDRVLECEPKSHLRAIKNVTINEPYFAGHFPGAPIMPGVLILEALAQAAGVLAVKSADQDLTENTLYYFVGINKARFKRPVSPGDQLQLEVKWMRSIRGIAQFGAEAQVDGQVVCSAELMCAFKESL